MKKSILLVLLILSICFTSNVFAEEIEEVHMAVGTSSSEVLECLEECDTPMLEETSENLDVDSNINQEVLEDTVESSLEETDVNENLEETDQTEDGDIDLEEVEENQEEPENEDSDNNEQEELEEKVTITVRCNDVYGNSIAIKTLEVSKDTEYDLSEISIDGYEFLSMVGQTSGIASEDFEVTFIYEEIKKEGKVIVSYVDNQDKKISEEKEVVGVVGESYRVEAKYIKGYDVIKVDGHEKGEFKEEDTHVRYVYAEVKSDIVFETKGSVIIQYLDALGTKLSGNVTLRGYAGNHYDAYVKKISGYKIVRVEGEEHGEFNSGTKHVVYVYEATKYGVGSTGRVTRTYPSSSYTSNPSSTAIPHTGVEDNGSGIMISAISFMILFFLRKRIYS